MSKNKFRINDLHRAPKGTRLVLPAKKKRVWFDEVEIDTGNIDRYRKRSPAFALAGIAGWTVLIVVALLAGLELAGL